MTAKELKAALLQEAVQGKLVPQIASEGNAKDLLEEIKKEKAKLIKEGKLKKDTTKAGASGRALPEIADDEIPFDIPENWCWCRLGNISSSLTDGVHFAPKYFEKGIPCFSAKDIFDDKINLSKCNYISKQDYELMKEKINVKTNSILVSKSGSIGRSAIVSDYFEFGLVESIGVINLIQVEPKYIKILLDNIFSQTFENEYTQGIAVKHLTLSLLSTIKVPLPPLAEQKRIVAAIEKFMPLIEEYGKKETELKDLNEQIGTLTKKAILQEAVQGKLVPQIAAEGNAKDLLEEIKKEKTKLIKEGKIKKEKTLSEITEEEIPFDIPESWCWCRLGDIVSILGDGIHGTPNYDISGNYYFVNGNNLNNGKIEIKPDTKKVNQSEYEKYKKELNKNTVFVSINGTLGNIAFYENEKIILGKSACYFNLIKNEMKKFIYWLIKTKYFLDYANQEATGTTIKNVSLAAMKHFPIPLPPLAEQKRIVAAIEKLLPLCEKLGE